MRYFKDKAEITRFIDKILVDQDKTLRYQFKFYEDEFYLKHYPKKYRSIDEIINDLGQNGFLFEIKRHIVSFGSSPIEDYGYMLLYTQLIDTLKKNNGIIDDLLYYKLLTINQACELLQLTRPSIYKLISNGEFPYVEIFGQKRIQMKDILDYVQKNKKNYLTK